MRGVQHRYVQVPIISLSRKRIGVQLFKALQSVFMGSKTKATVERDTFCENTEIIYLAVLKKAAIRHAYPYYAIYRKLPPLAISFCCKGYQY